VAVDKGADLRIDLEAASAEAASWRTRVEILFATLAVLGMLAWLAKSFVMVKQTL
jgi:hypothetical protein